MAHFTKALKAKRLCISWQEGNFRPTFKIPVAVLTEDKAAKFADNGHLHDHQSGPKTCRLVTLRHKCRWAAPLRRFGRFIIRQAALGRFADNTYWPGMGIGPQMATNSCRDWQSEWMILHEGESRGATAHADCRAGGENTMGGRRKWNKHGSGEKCFRLDVCLMQLIIHMTSWQSNLSRNDLIMQLWKLCRLIVRRSQLQ